MFVLAVEEGIAIASRVSVTPSCGTSSTHFVISAGGLPAAPYPCPDTCHFNAMVKLNGTSLNYQGANCSPDSYFVDLHDVPGQGCVACALPPGTHTVEFTGSTECAPNLQFPAPCVRDTFFVVTTTADPETTFVANGGELFVIGFNPCVACDVAACDSIYFIQVVQPLEDLGGGLPLSKYTYAQQGWPNAAARDSALTAGGYAVDVPPWSPDPYCKPYLGSMVGYAVGSKNGSCVPAFCSDNPNRGNVSYQAQTQRIVLKFEINAFCAAGDGQGHWLGGATWTWERPLGGPESITLGSSTRNWPSQAFLEALALWESLNQGFDLPGFSVPVTGGMPCP